MEKRVSVVIPTLNEEATIGDIVKKCVSLPFVKEVIVIDDHSEDRTREIAKEAGARVVLSNIKGKGGSMKEALDYVTGDIIVFIDGDLKNFDPDIVRKLATPIMEGKADFVKSSFSRKAGRVTELVAKPLLEIFFPEARKFSQPLSGMIAFKKSIASSLEFETDYGVDVGLLLDALMSGKKVIEVDIGFIDHKQKPWDKLKGMSREVAKAILKRAKKYGKITLSDLKQIEAIGMDITKEVSELERGERKMVIFDMDGVIFKDRFIYELARRFDFLDILTQLAKEPDTIVRTKSIAKLLKGISKEEIEKVADEMELTPGIDVVFKRLKEKGYIVGIISDSYTVVTERIRKRFGLDFSVANILEFKDGKATGEVLIPSEFFYVEGGCKEHAVCKANALVKKTLEYKVDIKNVIAVGDNFPDICMIKKAGMGVAFNPKVVELNRVADVVIEKDIRQLLDFI